MPRGPLTEKMTSWDSWNSRSSWQQVKCGAIKEHIAISGLFPMEQFTVLLAGEVRIASPRVACLAANKLQLTFYSYNTSW